MKDIRGFSCFVILGGMVLVLCCISTTAYASSDEPIFGVEPWFPILDIPDRGGPINWEDIDLDVKDVLLPEQPRFNGVPPIDIDGSLFDSYNLSTNSYGIAPSFDVTSSSGGVGFVTIVPEPATVLLLGLGALALRRKH